MIPGLERALYVKNFTIHLRFTDGAEGDVDLHDELHGEIFQPLRDKKLFQQFSVHPEFYTLTWSNGADIAPEFLYERLRSPI